MQSDTIEQYKRVLIQAKNRNEHNRYTARYAYADSIRSRHTNTIFPITNIQPYGSRVCLRTKRSVHLAHCVRKRYSNTSGITTFHRRNRFDLSLMWKFSTICFFLPSSLSSIVVVVVVIAVHPHFNSSVRNTYSDSEVWISGARLASSDEKIFV